MQGLENSIKKSYERQIIAADNNIDNIRIKRTTITRKEKSKEKYLYRYFTRQTGETEHEKKK